MNTQSSICHFITEAVTRKAERRITDQAISERKELQDETMCDPGGSGPCTANILAGCRSGD
jgi:hypothetical protein